MMELRAYIIMLDRLLILPEILTMPSRKSPKRSKIRSPRRQKAYTNNLKKELKKPKEKLKKGTIKLDQK